MMQEGLPIARTMWRLLWAATSLAAADRMDPGWVEPGWRCAAHDRAAPCLDLSTCRRGAARRKAIVSVFDAHGDTSATLQGFVKHRSGWQAGAGGRRRRDLRPAAAGPAGRPVPGGEHQRDEEGGH